MHKNVGYRVLAKAWSSQNSQVLMVGIRTDSAALKPWSLLIHTVKHTLIQGPFKVDKFKCENKPHTQHMIQRLHACVFLQGKRKLVPAQRPVHQFL